MEVGGGGGEPTPMLSPLILKKHGSAAAGCIHCDSASSVCIC